MPMRPSPAALVAAIALCFALASTSIAADPAAKLNKKKVAKIANKEIDKRAPGLSVEKAKTADSAKTAESATSAATAVSATSASQAQNAVNAVNAANADDIPDVTFQPLTLLNQWNQWIGAAAPAIGMSADGIVHLRGAMTRSGGAITTPFVIPLAFRPDTTVYVTTAQFSGATGRLTIESDGDVFVITDPQNATAASDFTSLDGVTYAP